MTADQSVESFKTPALGFPHNGDATSHLNSADDATVATMGELGRNLSGKETWFTEISCFAAADEAQKSNPAAALTYAQGYE